TDGLTGRDCRLSHATAVATAAQRATIYARIDMSTPFGAHRQAISSPHFCDAISHDRLIDVAQPETFCEIDLEKRNESELLRENPTLGAHPWMDAALIVFDAFVVFHLARRLAGLQYRTVRLRLGALRDFRQAEDVVEGLEEATAKLFHLGERMHFAPMI